MIQKKFRRIDLFPAITAEFNKQKANQKKLLDAYELDPANLPKPKIKQIYARNPTKKEKNLALKTVKETFHSINSGYHKIYDEHTGQIISLVEFIKFEELYNKQWEHLEFLCQLLHHCKEFISPVASKS